MAKQVLLTLATIIIHLFGFSSSLEAADINVLIVGSTRDSGEKFVGSGSWTSQKPYRSPTSRAFSHTKIATELKNILNGANIGSVNVSSEERYRSDNIPGWSVQSYNLASWFHYPYPVGVEESTRWPNLRGEKESQWDYVVLIGDPYTMEYTPGMYAHGVAQVAAEVAKGTAETLLMMPWPGSGSSSSIDHYKEVVYRAGRSGDLKVIPAGLAWQASNQNLGSSHPTNNGAYLAAASIFSKITGQNAANSSQYNYNDSLATTAYNTVNSQSGKSQYSGDFNYPSPYQMLEDKRRDIHFSSRGTSTEWGFRTKLYPNFQRMNMTYNEGSYNGKYSSSTPENDGMGWPSNTDMPIAFNLGRDGFYSESHKSYVVNPSYWQLAYGFYYQISTSGLSEEEKADAYISLMQTHDHDLANRMLNEQPGARNLPLRTLWARIHKEVPGSRPMRDNAHLSYEIDEAAAAFMFTMYSGRCSLDPEPATFDKTWHSQKIGYESAWMMGKCQTRAPGFKVKPNSSSSVLTPSSPHQMSVQFILKPKDNVTVTISTDDNYVGSVYPRTLTFTPGNHDVSQTITVIGETGAAGTFPFNVNFSTTSNDEVYQGLTDSWSYKNQRSAGPAPSDIRVIGNEQVIDSGDTTPQAADNTDFGIAAGTIHKTFYIRNRSATKNLSLTSQPRVTLSDASGYFSLTQDVSKSTLAPGEEIPFTVSYQPLMGGAHSASISIASDDSITPNYIFALLGKKPSHPTVVLDGATVVNSTSATIKGKMITGGYANATIYWGVADGGSTESSNWEQLNPVGGVLDNQSFSLTLTGLDVNKTYWYRCHVSNDIGSDWSDIAGTFSGEAISGGGLSSSQVLLSTNFSGRTINGPTAQNITWTVSGITDPGDIAIKRETPESNSNFGGIFNTSATSDFIAADRNIGNEGPWSLSIPLVPNVPGELTIDSLTMSWQDFTNTGSQQSGDLPKIFTASIKNAAQITLTSAQAAVSTAQGSTTITFTSPVTLSQGSSYTLNIHFQSNSNNTGNNTSIGSLSLEGTPTSSSPIWTMAPSNINSHSAQLNGAFDTNENLDVFVYWGNSNGSTNPNSWANEDFVVSGQGLQNFNHMASGLTAGQTLYYTYKAQSGSEAYWAPQSWSLTTAPNGSGSPIFHNISSSSEVGGSISPNGLTTKEEDESQIYSFISIPGYQIKDIIVDGISIGAVSNYTFSNIDADHTIKATFELTPVVTYNISASAGAGGTISPSGTTVIESGNDQTYSISSDPGFSISEVLVDGVSLGAVSDHTFSNVSTDHTINVEFMELPVGKVILLSTDFNNMTVIGETGSGMNWITQGLEQPENIVAVRETPEYKSTFGGLFTTNHSHGYFAVDRNLGNEGSWSVIIPIVSKSAGILIDEVAFGWRDFNNQGAYQAGSHPKIFTVSVLDHQGNDLAIKEVFAETKEGTTTCTFSESLSLSSGTSYSLKIRAENNQHLVGNNTGLDNVAVIGRSSNFYQINATSAEGGSISPEGIFHAESGSSLSFIITPDSGYKISNVIFDGISLGSLTNLDITSVYSNHTVETIFESISSPWTPAQISTEIWLDASASFTVLEDSEDVSEDLDKVYQWKDRSGKGRDLSQSSENVRPRYNVTGWSNGKPQVEFNTYNGKTKAHSLGRDITLDGMPSTGYTLFAAINPRSIDKESWLTSMRTTNGIEHRFQINNTGIKARSDSGNGGSATAPYALGEQILQLTMSSVSSEIRRNGTQVSGASGTFTNKVLAGDFVLSGRNSSDGHAGMDADLAEYILISGIPSTEIREKIEGYLAHKWNLQFNLPSEHPYKNVAPGGVVQNSHSLEYLSGPNGSVTGFTSQSVHTGSDGISVEAVASSGYVFAGWSDGLFDNPRVETDVQADITVTAMFSIQASVPEVILLSTNFDGMTALGDTATKIVWHSQGLAQPGDLVAVRETPEYQSGFGGLFSTPDSQGYLAVDRNIGNEGPWSVSIPLTPIASDTFIEKVSLGWRDFNNHGDYQSGTHPKIFSVIILDEEMNVLETKEISADTKEGFNTVSLDGRLILSTGSSYTLKIVAENNQHITGNNTAIDSIFIIGK